MKVRTIFKTLPNHSSFVGVAGQTCWGPGPRVDRRQGVGEERVERAHDGDKNLSA